MASPPPHRSTEQAVERTHLAYLDGVRGLAALYVVFTHAVLIAAPAHLANHDVTLPSWLAPGHYAVAVFIVVSGFCLSLPVVRAGGRLRGGAARFFARRARRILPPYYAAFLLTCVLVWTLIGSDTGTVWDSSVPVSAAGYVGNLLLLQNVVGLWQVSVPFWSIAVEAQIYLLFPLLLLCWRRFGAGRTLMTTIWLSYLALLGTNVAGSIGPLFFPGLTLHFVGLFSMGLAGAWLAFSQEQAWVEVRERVPWGLLAVLCAGIVLIVTYSANDAIGPLTPFLELPLALCAVSVLVAGSQPQQQRLRAWLGVRPLAYLGTFSYSLYLIHLPLLQVEWQYGLRPLQLGTGATLALLCLVGIPLVIAATFLFFLVCERPFMSERQRRAAAGQFADVPDTADRHSALPANSRAAPLPLVRSHSLHMLERTGYTQHP